MIRSISISNYKSINKLDELKFGYFNFLIGPNGAGKTTLISAIDLTRKLASGKNIDESVEQTTSFSTEFFNQYSSNNLTDISITVKDNHGELYNLKYSIGSELGQYEIAQESLTRLLKDAEIPIYTRNHKEFNASAGKDNKLDAVPLVIKDNELALSTYNNPVVNEVAKLISGYKVLWVDKTWDEAHKFKVHFQDKLDQNNLDGLAVSLYRNNKSNFNKAMAIIEQLIPGFKTPTFNIARRANEDEEEDKKNIDPYFVMWNEADTNLSYSLRGLSEGNFRIIQLILAIFSCNKSTCLIGEEIENGLHFGRIKTLLEVLRHLSSKLDVQLIFTTHSLEILGHVSPSDVIFSSRDEKGYSLYENLDNKHNTEFVKQQLDREPTAKDYIDLGMV